MNEIFPPQDTVIIPVLTCQGSIHVSQQLGEFITNLLGNRPEISPVGTLLSRRFSKNPKVGYIPSFPWRVYKICSGSRLGGGNSNIFFFTPTYLGEDDFQFDDNIFQRGWFNHQLGMDIFRRLSWSLPPKTSPFSMGLLWSQGQNFLLLGRTVCDQEIGHLLLDLPLLPLLLSHGCAILNIPVEGFLEGNHRGNFFWKTWPFTAWSGWWILRIWSILGGGNSNIFWFSSRKLGVSWSNLTVAYFSKGLVQPPKRKILKIKHQLKTCSPGSPGLSEKQTLLEALFKGPPNWKRKISRHKWPNFCVPFSFFDTKFCWIWRGWYFFVGKNSRMLLIMSLPGRWLGNQAPNQTYWQCLRLLMGN